MCAKTFTGYFIIFVFLLVIIYDVIVMHYYGTDASISCVINRTNDKYPLLAPIVAFFMGCLWAHFFWPVLKSQ